MKNKNKQQLLPDSYKDLITDLKHRVRAAQQRAALSVNRELVCLYWDIGREVLNRQNDEGWGAKVIDRLASDLRFQWGQSRVRVN